MNCTKYNKEFLTACLNGDPGISRLYIANYNDITSFTTDPASEVTLSGMTTSGQTSIACFYQLELLQDVGAVVDTPTIAVSNGVAISIPSVKGKISVTDVNTLTAFNQLKRTRTVVVYENMEGVLFCTGIKRGLFMSAGTAGSDESTFEGITFELKGKEPIGQYILGTDLQERFKSLYVVTP